MNGQITWIDNILYNVTLFGNKTNEVLSHAAWVNLGKIMRSERSQSQTLHIVRFHLLQTQSVPRESSGDKVGSRVAWDEGVWGNCGGSANGHGMSLEWWKSSFWERHDSANTLETPIVHGELVNCVVWETHLSQAAILKKKQTSHKQM